MTQRIFDFHAHIFPNKIADKAVQSISDFYTLKMAKTGTAENLLAAEKPAGVEKFVVHSVATTPKQVPSINSFLYDEMQKHPEFVGFAAIHPLQEDIDATVTNALSKGFKGLKIHPDFQHFALDDPKAIEMFKIIDGRLPVLIHTGDFRYDYSNPFRMAKALEAVPSLIAIGAHFGGWSEWRDSAECLLGHDRFYIDTSSSLYFLEPEVAASMIRRHGVERTFFGTDYPMWDIHEEIQRFNSLPLTESEKQAVFYDNAAAFLHI